MIKYLDLKKITALHKTEIDNAVSRVISSGWYLRGDETRCFEQEYAAFIGAKYCVSCGNGLDSLSLILRSYIEMGRMRKGDEVIVPANTYIASILAVSECGLNPVLIEPRIDTFQIDDTLIRKAINPRTCAVMAVHLYGHCAVTDALKDLCEQHKLLLIEDNAQAHGCLFNGQRTGSLGNAAGHSFYPGKNLGALGDAGAVTTNDEELVLIVRTIGNYGSERKYVFDYQGRNSRMDELQAAVLRVKLKYLDSENNVRIGIANRYINEIRNEKLRLPSREYCANSVHHIFPVLTEQRDELRDYLLANGVETMIHYPIPPHLQRCYSEFNGLNLPITESIHRQELSIPLNPALQKEEVDLIIKLLNEF